MNKDIKENIILEEFDNEFSFKKNKSNLKIEFNRIAFLFFYFFCNFDNLFYSIASSRQFKIKYSKYQNSNK